MEQALVLLERRGSAACLTLNRLDKKNALNQALLLALNQQLAELAADDNVRAVILTGGMSVFAAGADIKEMAEQTFVSSYHHDFIRPWDEVAAFSKPVIAAISGMALGGGLELAMSCDLLIASETALLGQPEINLGITPGAGGTQRLLRAVGKAKAMEMCLTGTPINAVEALQWGLVSQVLPVEELLPTAWALAEKIASFSLPVLRMVKEDINQAFELNLQAGIRHERRLFQACFSLVDQKEGMGAFLAKRKPNFTHK